MVDKVIRDGKVAVLYAPDDGGVWGSAPRNRKVAETMIFHPRLVEAVENKTNNPESMGDILLELTGEDVYTGAAWHLEIAWIDEGTRFFISEYDSSESIVIIDPDFGFTA